MKKIIAILAAVLMLTAVLTACGEEKKEATPDSTAVDSAVKENTDSVKPEQLKKIETTDNGTVEEDKEGNVLTIDKEKKIVSVKDKDGSEVSAAEYITTHYVVSSDGTIYGEPGNNSDPEKKDSSSKAESGSSKASSQGASSKSAENAEKDKPASSSSKEEEEEKVSSEIAGELELEEYELPIL